MSNKEVIAALRDPKIIKQAVEEIFAKVDKDHSGKIDRKELKTGLRIMGKEIGIPEPTDKDIDETLKALDTNNDGQIDKNEMEALVKALFEIMIAELEK